MNDASESNCFRLRWRAGREFDRAISSAPESELLLITSAIWAPGMPPELIASRIDFKFDPLPDAKTAMRNFPVNVRLSADFWTI